MTFKSEVTSIARKVGRRVEGLPDQVKDARVVVRGWIRGWNRTSLRLVQKRPGAILVGALAIGFILAKVARYA